MEYALSEILLVKSIDKGDIITDIDTKFKVINKTKYTSGINKDIRYSYNIQNLSTGEVFCGLSRLKIFIYARRLIKQLKRNQIVRKTWKVIRKHYMLFADIGRPEYLYDIMNLSTRTILTQLTYSEVYKIARGKNIDMKRYKERKKFNKEWINSVLNRIYLVPFKYQYNLY